MRTNVLQLAPKIESKIETPGMVADGSLIVALRHESEDPQSISTSKTILPTPVVIDTRPASSMTTSPDRKSYLGPKDYKDEYADDLLEFFMDAPKTHTITETFYMKDGSQSEKEKEVPNAPPSFVDFAHRVGCTTRQLVAWGKKHPMFGEAIAECNEIVKQFIIDNGITAKYSSQFAIFVAKNVTDMKDKTEHTRRDVNVNKLIDQIQSSPTPAALRAANKDDIYETEF